MHASRTPFYGFDHVHAGRGPTATNRAATTTVGSMSATRKAKKLSRAEEQSAARLHLPAGLSHCDPSGTLSTTFLWRARLLPISTEANRDEPFFLMVSFPDPHHRSTHPASIGKSTSRPTFLCRMLLRNDWTPPALVQNIIKDRESGKADLIGMNTIGVSAREAQEARALTCGMIACIDDAIGRVLGTLDGGGLHKNTVVIFTSDHGDHLGDHRLMLKGAEQYEASCGSRSSGRTRSPRVSQPAATLSHQPSIYRRPCSTGRRCEPFSGIQAKSLLPAIENGVAVRELHFSPIRPSDTEPWHEYSGAGSYLGR